MTAAAGKQWLTCRAAARHEREARPHLSTFRVMTRPGDVGSLSSVRGKDRVVIAMVIRPRPGRSRAGPGGAWTRILLALAVAIGIVALASCSSSKPAYCTDRANLENAVKGLNVSGGISGLETQFQMVQSAATALVNSAKGDFPSQTSAITSSVDALKSAFTSLPSNPSIAQLATVTKDVANVVSSVKSFTDASSSACS